MTTTTAEQTVLAKKITPFFKRWHSPWLNGKLLLGLVIFLAMVSIEFVGPLFWDKKLAFMAAAPTNIVPIWVEGIPGPTFKPANPAHPLGTESQGRDMLAVLIVGTPRSLRVGLIGAGLGMLVGIVLGFTAGLLGGWVDSLISTLADVVITIPGLAVLVVIASYIPQVEVINMALIMALFAWPLPTRLIRSQVLSMRERGYVQRDDAQPFALPGCQFHRERFGRYSRRYWGGDAGFGSNPHPDLGHDHQQCPFVFGYLPWHVVVVEPSDGSANYYLCQPLFDDYWFR